MLNGSSYLRPVQVQGTSCFPERSGEPLHFQGLATGRPSMEEEFAEFGAIDSEGFRTFSMTLEDGSEIARVSLHIDRISKKFPDYTNDEKNALLTAASIAAARNDSCLNDPQTVLTTIVQRLLPT